MERHAVDVAIYIRDERSKSQESTLQEQQEACMKKAEELGCEMIERRNK